MIFWAGPNCGSIGGSLGQDSRNAAAQDQDQDDGGCDAGCSRSSQQRGTRVFYFVNALALGTSVIDIARLVHFDRRFDLERFPGRGPIFGLPNHTLFFGAFFF